MMTEQSHSSLPLVEQIAKQWDGCSFDGGGGCVIDIGEAIRTAAKCLTPSVGTEESHNAVIDQIARQWDGCVYEDAVGCGDIDIGEAIRAADTRFRQHRSTSATSAGARA